MIRVILAALLIAFVIPAYACDGAATRAVCEGDARRLCWRFDVLRAKVGDYRGVETCFRKRWNKIGIACRNALENCQ